jgi:two-component system, chemotaxis family, sensor kinase CheA
MSRPPEDRGAELRSLFFESAYELLQALNEGGLQLETRPGDEEVLRSVRRVIHTLKGDSAACGFTKLSELAHEFEDVLTPQLVASRGATIAEIVLAAADNFGAMLSAYERGIEPAPPVHLQELMRRLLDGPVDPSNVAQPVHDLEQIPAQFAWTEYEHLMISEAVHRHEFVFNLALRVDPNSLMRAAAFQLIRNVLHGCGTVIALRPEDNIAASTVEVVEAAVATQLNAEEMAQRCRIPSIVSGVRIDPAATAEAAEHELLDDLLEVQAHLATDHHENQVATPANAVSTAVAARAESSLRVDAARIDAVMNLVGELIIGRSMLNRSLTEFDKMHARDPIRAKLADAMAFQTRVLDELHKCVLKIRMVPVEQLFRRFPRVVRDVAKQCGKDVALQVSGQNTDLDKGILDSLAEPLMHLVRNAVDHGIEPADERVLAGKPARGTIFLKAFHQGAQVVIEVRDDGRGMDAGQLRTRAIEKGILKLEEANRLTDQEAFNLIFEPGFSTAITVTEVSGRGVGMDVVRAVMDKLKGTVHVTTQAGKGSAIQMRTPLTLASIQTLLFRVGGRLFAVPLSSVVEITRVQENEIHIVNQREILRLRDQLLTLVRLNRLDHIHAVSNLPVKKTSFVIVIGSADKRFGLVVDSLVGEEELVIKALPNDIVSSHLVTGASILGDGTVVLILNVPAVVAKFSKVLPLGAIA